MKRYLIVILCLLWAGAASAQDAINLSTAVVHNSPADVASWALTTRITKLTMQPEGTRAPGLSFEFAARATWPDYTPPGWEGPIQYTVWAGVRISGVWHVAGIIRMWREREATGAPILTNNNFARNWVYDSRWGAMAGYQPVAGEAMIFFVTAGNARGVTTVTSVRERSNVVMVNLPANDSGVFTFPILTPGPYRQTDLVIDFGHEGVWTLGDASVYAKASVGNAKNIVTGDLDRTGIDEVIADFGPGVGGGIWIFWNNATWVQAHGASALSMVTADLDGNGTAELLAAFPDYGTWVLANGTSWVKLGDQFPSEMLATNFDGGSQELVLNVPGSGVWILRNNSVWDHITTQNATAMVAGDFDGNGIGDVAFAFPGSGVWLYVNGGAWANLAPQDAAKLASGDLDGNGRSDLVADFGTGSGVWVLRDTGQWLHIIAQPAQQIVVADVDGSGHADIILNLSTGGGGLWVLANLNTWVRAHPVGPERIVAATLN